MIHIQEAIAKIIPASGEKAKEATMHWNARAKPLGALGLLEDAVTRMCAMTGTLQPETTKRCVVVFCADNGVVCEGVTQTGSEVTAMVAKNLCIHETSVCKMARIANCDVIPVDVGMLTVVEDEGIHQCAVAKGTQNMKIAPAMTLAQAIEAIEVGINLAQTLSHEGYGIFATGEMGIGNTTTSSAMASVLLKKPVSTMTGAGAGLSKEGILRKIQVIEEAIACNEPNPEDPIDVLRKVGGFDIAGMVGLFIGCAMVKKPCLIDGFISGVAALCAVAICPSVKDYMVASHVSAEPAGRLVLETLGLLPLICAGMRLGEGTGAVAALPLVDMAFAVFHEMPSFGQTAIEEYKPL